MIIRPSALSLHLLLLLPVLGLVLLVVPVLMRARVLAMGTRAARGCAKAEAVKVNGGAPSRTLSRTTRESATRFRVPP